MKHRCERGPHYWTITEVADTYEGIAFVGRNDLQPLLGLGVSVNVVVFDSLADAEDFLNSFIMAADKAGVEAGDYYIDVVAGD